MCACVLLYRCVCVHACVYRGVSVHVCTCVCMCVQVWMNMLTGKHLYYNMGSVDVHVHIIISRLLPLTLVQKTLLLSAILVV